MSTRIAFLRAVNVGRRTVSMATVVELCAGLGYRDPWTHANSGNAIFDAGGSRTAIETALARALEDAFGFEVTTFVRTPAELGTALALEPFPVAAGDTYFITFLKQAPSADVKRKLEAASNDFDTLVVAGRDVHWRMRGKSTDTTLKAATWNLVGERASTSRNVNLLRALHAKVESRNGPADRGRRGR